MPTSLDLDAHLEAIDARARLIRDALATTGPDAPVPTCPGWTLGDLVTHQGGVHGWAAAHARAEKKVSSKGHFDSPAEVSELVSWSAVRVEGLLTALRHAPEDLQAMRFLHDPPPPRRFWARRQAHETAIHSVDALAAQLGRSPTTTEAAIDRGLAVDGLDELLTGFLPRGTTRLRSEEPVQISVSAQDVDASWTVEVGAGPPTVTSGATDAADLTVRGTAAQLYLALWNRGEEIEVSGRQELLALWRSKFRVRWSG